MVDRFANGNESNDFFNIPPEQQRYFNSSSQGSPFGLASFRHGGDFEGIINRLGYLTHLGVNTLWITPVLSNCGGEYHGYCPSSFFEMDPNFGDMDTYARLVQAAHKSDILVVQDLVINHVCGCASSYNAPPKGHTKCASVLDSQFWAGEVVGDSTVQGNISFADTFFGPFKSEYFFNRCGPNRFDWWW